MKEQQKTTIHKPSKKKLHVICLSSDLLVQSDQIWCSSRPVSTRADQSYLWTYEHLHEWWPPPSNWLSTCVHKRIQ